MTDMQGFSPDWVSPPGDTIADLLDEKGWEQAALAERTGFSRKHINELIQGRAAISPDTAQRLATVLGSTIEFWLTREAHYRATLQRRDAEQALDRQASWLREIPVAWMVKQGLLKRSATKRGQVAECLRYFGVASVDAWRQTCTNPLAAFRASEKVTKYEGAVAAWLRAAEIAALPIRCKAFDADQFRSALGSLRSLASERDPAVFVPRLQEACSVHGVAVVFVPAPPGCPIHGATRWLTSDKALLALSLRYKSNDQLWFSFFHEVAHLLKHGKKLLFIEGLDGLDEGKEREANRFASELLIPATQAERLRGLRSAAEVECAARELKIDPGIVVGRMQHEGWLAHSHLNHLKVRYRWTSDE